MKITKYLIMSSVAASALVPMAAFAQAAPQDAAGSEEIVVTARRSDEKLRDVPASVTVITAGAIANTGARVAADYVQLTPGVTIVAGVVEAGDTQIAIRGINGARDGENNVALVVDGVLKSNTALLAQDQGALTQIEILKGPQGAYYGRSAVAGAIVITTKKPGDRLEVSGRVSAANNSTFAGAAVISGPLGPNVGFVINGEYATTDGFYRDIFQTSPLYATTYPNQAKGIAASVDDNKRFNINGRLLFTPSTDTEIDVKARYSKLKGSAIGFNAIFQLPGLAAAINAPVFNIDANDHQFVFARNINPQNNQESFEASIRLAQTLSDSLRLTGYVSYSNTKNDFYADGTSGTFGFFNNESTCMASTAALTGFPVQAPFAVGVPGAFLNPYSPITCDGTQYQQRDQKDISAEIRLAGDAGDSVNWSLGSYYLNIDRFNCNNLGLDTGQGVIRKCYTTDPRNRTEALAQDSFKTNVYAVFGSLEYKPTDQLTLSAAARYDIEQRSTENGIPTGRLTRWVGNVLTGVPNGTATTPANYYLNPGLDPAYNPSGVLAPRKATFKQIQPKISISYAATADLSIFANWGIGFKTGGFNNAGSAAIVNGFFNTAPISAGLSIFDDYKKETSSAFEAGVKGSIAPGVSFELAGYYTNVKDSQFFEFFVGPFGLLRVVSNIDKVTFKGVEGSFNARIMQGFTVFGSANYTDGVIKKNSARPYTVGNTAPATSKYTINLGAQYDGPITDTFGLLLRADYRLTGPTYFHTVQNNDVPTQFGLGANYSNSKRDAYGILNLRAGIKTDHWSLVAFANNVTKKRYLAEVIVAPEFGGGFVAPGALRTIGVEGTFKF